MAANATAHLHFVMAGTRQTGGGGSERGGDGGGEGEGERLLGGAGGLVAAELPFSIIQAWLSPPIVKMLTGPSE